MLTFSWNVVTAGKLALPFVKVLRNVLDSFDQVAWFEKAVVHEVSKPKLLMVWKGVALLILGKTCTSSCLLAFCLKSTINRVIKSKEFLRYLLNSRWSLRATACLEHDRFTQWTFRVWSKFVWWVTFISVLGHSFSRFLLFLLEFLKAASMQIKSYWIFFNPKISLFLEELEIARGYITIFVKLHLFQILVCDYMPVFHNTHSVKREVRKRPF